MTDLLDKTILIGIGLEKKAREVLDELSRVGEAAKEGGKEGESEGAEGSEGGTGKGLSARQLVENRIVEDGVKVLKEFLCIIEAGKKKFVGDISSSSGKVAEKLHVATTEEVDIVKEMARVAREKVDKLEKRVAEIEKGLGSRD